MLKRADKRWHALTTDQVQCTVANLIDCLGFCEGVLLESLNVRVFAAHHGDDYISHLAYVEDRIGIVPIDFLEYQTLFTSGKVSGA